MILIIDNYDSFTYNLVHLIASNLVTGGPAAEVRSDEQMLVVRRNDKISLEEIRDFCPKGILISPGPGRPEDAGISQDVVKELSGEFPILGVCLGHQIIGETFGGMVTYAPKLMHGKTSIIRHDAKSIFESVAPDFTATRYHSLVVEPGTVSDDLDVTATTPDGVIMGLRHKHWAVEGIQFHPESILTTEGPRIISNWVRQCLRESTVCQ